MRALSVDCGVPRRVHNPTPTGRSLRIPSPLWSNPVVSVYGYPEFACHVTPTFRLRSSVLFTLRLNQYGRSPGPFPHSVASVPLGGTSNANPTLRLARIHW